MRRAGVGSETRVRSAELSRAPRRSRGRGPPRPPNTVSHRQMPGSASASTAQARASTARCAAAGSVARLISAARLSTAQPVSGSSRSERRTSASSSHDSSCTPCARRHLAILDRRVREYAINAAQRSRVAAVRVTNPPTRHQTGPPGARPSRPRARAAERGGRDDGRAHARSRGGEITRTQAE